MGSGAVSKATKGQCNAKDTKTHTVTHRHACDRVPSLLQFPLRLVVLVVVVTLNCMRK